MVYYLYVNLDSQSQIIGIRRFVLILFVKVQLFHGLRPLHTDDDIQISCRINGPDQAGIWIRS